MRLAVEVHIVINNKRFTLSIMIEIEKAFNLVWHEDVLYKMEQLGLYGKVLEFDEAFLKDQQSKFASEQP